MAHHSSALKAIRKTEKETLVNRNRIGRIRTFIKKVEQAILSKQKDVAQTAFKEAQPEIMRGVSKGILHINTAARKLSRLSARIKQL